ncbi:phosphoadenosine phosphosulfate reductase family protein [Streptomyces sp. NRRL S-350]|uniref:phosphoadenosine phosphosulfate reductase family protein n=1 Tax=Streptomyces sp. NRRL S-350 TaxID=1463902 RepID=UPI00099B73A6|nr:phosphoadenosine phosphosulfate reductase family protein [Streptomyces sp. NRRL S-350]
MTNQLALFEAPAPVAAGRPCLGAALPQAKRAPRTRLARIGEDLERAARLIAEHGLSPDSCAEPPSALTDTGARSRQPEHGALHPVGAIFLAAHAAETPRRPAEDPVRAGAVADRIWARCDEALRYLADRLDPAFGRGAVERIAGWVAQPGVGLQEVLAELARGARKARPLPKVPIGYVQFNPKRHGPEGYDWIVVASSGGKDSQAMLDEVVRSTDAAGVPRDRIVVVHNDLDVTDSGESIEWPGTMELAREQAEHYGLRFVTLRRPQGGLWRQLLQRRMWPSSSARWCTSDQKSAQALKLLTALVQESRRAGVRGRPVRILYCLGLRAQESAGRAGKAPIAVDRSASNGQRTVVRWHPIHDWSERQVWERIAETGIRYHWAYDAGMERLSCSLCVLSSGKDLVCAARLRRPLAVEYVGAEAEIGHRFQDKRSMAEVLAEADRLNAAEGELRWERGDALRRHVGEAAAAAYLALAA